MMELDNEQIESQLRLHVDRLAGLIGPRYLQKPKTITATIGYIEGQWAGMGYTSSRECYDALGDQATNIVVEQPGSKRSGEIEPCATSRTSRRGGDSHRVLHRASS